MSLEVSLTLFPKLDQIKPGHGYAPAVEMNGKSRRPDTSHDEKKMAEQLEVK